MLWKQEYLIFQGILQRCINFISKDKPSLPPSVCDVKDNSVIIDDIFVKMLEVEITTTDFSSLFVVLSPKLVDVTSRPDSIQLFPPLAVT